MTRLSGALVVLALSRMPAAGNDQEPSRFEISLGLNRALSLLDATFISSYAPPSVFEPSRATAGQTLALHGEPGSGFDFGVRYFPARRLGIELRVGYLRTSIGGENDSYRYSHQFVTKGSALAAVPELVTHEGSLAWPDTQGRLRQITLALNGVTRWRSAERVVTSLSAGLSYLRLAGGASSLGFTSFELSSGRSVAVDQYQASFAVEPIGQLGFNAGAEWDFALARNLSVVIDCRYFYAGATPVPVHLERVVTKTPVAKRIGVKEIESALHPGPVELNPSFSAILFGLKYRR